MGRSYHSSEGRQDVESLSRSRELDSSKLLENPVAEAASNRTGTAYVIRRMDWYWNLSGVLLKKKNVLNDGPSDGLRDILEADLIDLYQQLLLYQMKTALSCYGSQT